MALDILIVGAGLSGLALADMLSKDAQNVAVLEARDRVGGRILSTGGPAPTQPMFDMGPAWVWPHQRHMLALIERLGLSLMPQSARGKLVFEDAAGAVRRDLDFATMGDALRVSGGLSQIPDALASVLPPAALRLGHAVTQLQIGQDDLIEVHGSAADGPFQIAAHRVVLALPPRLAATLTFAPALPAALCARMAGVATWMAGHGKVMAVYDTPFWRDAGLSGDAISHRGPLMEIHDAAADPQATAAAALFGFIHPNHLPRSPGLASFEASVLDQLGHLFGPRAATPRAVHVKLWADDPHTATEADRSLPKAHPDYAPLSVTPSNWTDRLWLCGTETAEQEGGFLEGALIAAHETYHNLRAQRAT